MYGGLSSNLYISYLSVPNAEFSSVVHGTAENLINKLEENLTSACHGDVITDPVSPRPVPINFPRPNRFFRVVNNRILAIDIR